MFSLQKSSENEKIGLCETVLIVGLTKSCGVIRTQRWTGSTMVKVTVTPFTLFIEAEVIHDVVTVSNQTMQMGDEDESGDPKNKKDKEKEGKISKMIDDEMQKVIKKIQRTGVIMHGRGLSGKVGAGINISCGIISAEIELSIQLTSVVTTAPADLRATFSGPIENIASGHSDVEVPFSKQVFDKYDKDKSGEISYKEFEDLCFDLGHKLSPEELVKATKILDADGSKSISYPEFQKWWQTDDKFKNLHFGSTEQEAVSRAIKYFRRYDRDKSGTLDKKEFKRVHEKLVAEKLTTKDYHSVLEELDTDHSGTISFNEYVEWLVNV
eukprot:TRINITY_DN7511_c0_g1_i1.p1 TRINITY_DN7511_c0_g1~~TRINITY_DN7511_c0_g1_i1.p1  ORF type:complete len:325 (-),score=74.95 TRINITY_DN7511_c0_g1_i1:157-1131(-)